MSNLETRAREIALNHEQVAKSYGRATAMDTTAALIEAEVYARCAALEALALELANNLAGYMAASDRMNAAMQDGVNVHGAVSELYGYTEMSNAALSSPLLAELRAKEAGR